MRKFPKMKAGLRGSLRQIICTVELDDGQEGQAPVVQFVADHREGVDPEKLSYLFASSPDMLEALRIVVGNLKAHGNATPLLFGALVKAEAAIAKAEGRNE